MAGSQIQTQSMIEDYQGFYKNKSQESLYMFLDKLVNYELKNFATNPNYTLYRFGYKFDENGIKDIVKEIWFVFDLLKIKSKRNHAGHIKKVIAKAYKTFYRHGCESRRRDFNPDFIVK